MAPTPAADDAAGVGALWAMNLSRGAPVPSPMRSFPREALVEPPAGFDEPMDMLLGCHRRIEKQLRTLRRLREHVAAQGIDAEASIAARNVLRYFESAAAHHHADEEVDLLPMLGERIRDEGERHRFHAFREALLADHRALEGAWARLRKPLEGIAEGLNRSLPAAEVATFCDGYARHIIAEEATLRGLVDRWLDEADRMALGRAMAARRGV